MKSMKSVLIILLFSFIRSGFCCNGCVALDELTFEKVVKKFTTVLVKFDQMFPFGDTHDAYTTLSAEINNKSISGFDHKDLLIATVGIKDYGEFDNKALGEKYGRSTSIKMDSPVIKLFNDGDLDNPIGFEIGKDEKITVGHLYTFLKIHSKTRVQIPGCILELDNLADQFVKDASKRQQILEDTEAFIQDIENEEQKKLSRTYTALMKGVIEKGENFVNTQRERMNKLLKDKLSESKIAEINKKLNIVASFKFSSPPKEEL